MGKHEETKQKIKLKKDKKYIKRRLFIFIILVLIVTGALFAKRVYDLNGNWVAALFGHNKYTLERLDKLYVLVMGESKGLSDTILVCSYDPKDQRVSMLSIPRDTFVGKSKSRVSAYNKINSLYKSGKTPEKTLAAVNELTGLNVKSYVIIDTEALVKFVDKIGGINFDVPIDMKYGDTSQDLHINLKKGMQKLNGEQVEQLVRFRHNADGSTYPYEYGMEDFGRMRTQREVIKAVAKQAIQFKNIKEVMKLLDISKEYVRTDINLNNLKDYIPYAVKMNIENIKSEQLPGHSEYISGISFFIADSDKTQEVVNTLFNE